MSQAALKERINENWLIFQEQMPELTKGYEQQNQEAYAGGALSGKQKRLMALCAALIKGCRACILYQTDHALTLGATVDEILETCAVAVSLGGTMAAGEATRVVEYLREKKLL